MCLFYSFKCIKFTQLYTFFLSQYFKDVQRQYLFVFCLSEPQYTTRIPPFDHFIPIFLHQFPFFTLLAQYLLYILMSGRNLMKKYKSIAVEVLI